MNGGMGMGMVRVSKDVLLETVRANREKHRSIFLSAVDGFRAKAIALMEERLTDAKQGRRINIYINLPTPVDQTREYDKVIKMLEMSVDLEIELTSSEFGQYVMDDWTWKKQFTATNSAYTIATDTFSPVADDE